MQDVLKFLIDYIGAIPFVLFPLFVIHCFYDDSVTVSWKKIIIIACISLLSCIEFIVPQTEPFMTLIVFLAAPLIAVMGDKIPFRRRLKNWSRYFFIWMIISIMLLLLTMSVCSFGNYTEEDETLIFSILSVIYSTVLSLIMYLVYIRRDKSLLFRKQDKILVWLYLCFGMFLSGIDSDTEQPRLLFNAPDNIKDYLLIIFIIIMTNCLPFFIIRNCQSAHYSRLSEHQQYFLEAELNASKQYKAAQEETRAFRHDVQNNLSAISMLMEQGKYTEAKQFLDDMCTEVSSFSPKIITGDEMLDSLISAKLPRMQENRIKLTINGTIDGGLGWKPMDICTVFANAIDNAIEASSKTDDGEQRYITMNIKKTSHQFLISIENNCSKDTDCEILMNGELHFTSKSDKSLHGYGLRNAKRIIEKNGGMMKIGCENKRFSLNMILSRNENALQTEPSV